MCGQYVAESRVNREMALANKPGQEDFVARCIILKKTTYFEVFRYASTTHYLLKSPSVSQVSTIAVNIPVQQVLRNLISFV